MTRSISISVALLAGLVSLASCTNQPQASSSLASGSPRGIASTQSLQDRVMLGRAVVTSSGCGDCHGGTSPANAGWLVGSKSEADTSLVDGFKTYAANLTPDPTTGVGRYTDRQIFNALRYGLRPSTTPDVEITSSVPGQGNFPSNPDYLAPSMPWMSWRHKTDEELWAIAAYLKNGVKPVNQQTPKYESPPDHWAKRFAESESAYPAPAYPTANETGVSNPQVLRGRQVVLAHACAECHGGSTNPAVTGYLAGVKIPARDEFQIGPFRTRPRNLTPDNTTGMGRFSERQIFNALRYGLRPGETPDVEITSSTPGQGNFPARPKYLAPPMPWITWRHMSDDDLRAIAAYLKQGVKPVSNRVADSEGPPDFWASAYTVELIGPYPSPPFPTMHEKGSK